ncbi:hypothetical protein BKA69DRAFT_1173144 [Paraphysoderma sedebokerense]|nr:hypothetical protein BKA69DRAFT_1173144 [Paraphysoderma sedebokerense]
MSFWFIKAVGTLPNLRASAQFRSISVSIPRYTPPQLQKNPERSDNYYLIFTPGQSRNSKNSSKKENIEDGCNGEQPAIPTTSAKARSRNSAHLTNDYSSYKVLDLKQLCRERTLKVSGNKAELIQRLLEWDKSRLNETEPSVIPVGQKRNRKKISELTATIKLEQHAESNSKKPEAAIAGEVNANRMTESIVSCTNVQWRVIEMGKNSPNKILSIKNSAIDATVELSNINDKTPTLTSTGNIRLAASSINENASGNALNSPISTPSVNTAKSSSKFTGISGEGKLTSKAALDTLPRANEQLQILVHPSPVLFPETESSSFQAIATEVVDESSRDRIPPGLSRRDVMWNYILLGGSIAWWNWDLLL